MLKSQFREYVIYLEELKEPIIVYKQSSNKSRMEENQNNNSNNLIDWMTENTWAQR